MRVIGGTLAGRTFQPPLKKWRTRPTTDKAKEALYNILNNSLDFKGINALDLFSGSGNHSYELVSRGAATVVAVDSNQACLHYIRSTAAELEIKDAIHPVHSDVYRFLQADTSTYDLIIADPPYKDYRLPQLPEIVLNSDTLLKDTGIFVLEHSKYHNFKFMERCFDTRQYGLSIFSFFR